MEEFGAGSGRHASTGLVGLGARAAHFCGASRVWKSLRVRRESSGHATEEGQTRLRRPMDWQLIGGASKEDHSSECANSDFASLILCEIDWKSNFKVYAK